KLNVEARTLTSDEGLAIALERERATQEKEAEKKRRDEERQSKEREEQLQREAQARTAIFRGGISSKNKTQLKDLAYALSLPMDGTAKDLIARISEHFETHPDLKTQSQFEGIFS
ncbi:hypothetical protein R3P38DRAFT_2401356, partial [Favolaschia claudopus]